MLQKWEFFGNIGASRWTAFFADGDGNFRPKILIDGKKPKQQKIVEPKHFNFKNIIIKDITEGQIGDYAIDFDTIAWALLDD